MIGGFTIEKSIIALKDMRITYGVSQTKLATVMGISREHLNRIECGKAQVTKDMEEQYTIALEKLNPENALEMLFDYVRIRFPTRNIEHIIKDILKLNIEYMLHEDFGFYSYTEHYHIGDVFVLTSEDEKKGVLIELKGKGCRQMESYLLGQGRNWYEFLMECLEDGGVIKRLDLAIDDMVGILDIPELTNKCNLDECVTLFRNFKSYRSGDLVQNKEEEKSGMGHTLYVGSLKSEIYFCIYEKAYEQYSKFGVAIENTIVKNRFEIRLKNKRAYYAVVDLLTYHDAERTAFNIINRYLRFVDKEEGKPHNVWKTNHRWAWFIGQNRGRLKLTTKPESYTLEQTLRWIARQVAPTLKMLEKIDLCNGTEYVKHILMETKLSDKHKQIIKQLTTSPQEVVLHEKERE